MVTLIYESTEEGQKVSRNKGEKWPAVFRRLDAAEAAKHVKKPVAAAAADG